MEFSQISNLHRAMTTTYTMEETLYGYVSRAKRRLAQVIVYWRKTDYDFAYGNINGDLHRNSKTTSFSLPKDDSYLHRQKSIKSNRTNTLTLSIYKINIPNLSRYQIKYLARKWYHSIAIFNKSGGSVSYCKSYSIPSKQHQKQIIIKITVTKPATETPMRKNFSSRKITTHPPTRNNGYKSARKAKEKAKNDKMASNNADCNTINWNKYGKMSNQIKIHIFEERRGS